MAISTSNRYSPHTSCVCDNIGDCNFATVEFTIEGNSLFAHCHLSCMPVTVDKEVLSDLVIV